LRDNGAVLGAALGFTDNDQVVVLTKYDNSKCYVVAHVDGIRSCGEDLILCSNAPSIGGVTLVYSGGLDLLSNQTSVAHIDGEVVTGLITPATHVYAGPDCIPGWHKLIGTWSGHVSVSYSGNSGSPLPNYHAGGGASITVFGGQMYAKSASIDVGFDGVPRETDVITGFHLSGTYTACIQIGPGDEVFSCGAHGGASSSFSSPGGAASASASAHVAFSVSLFRVPQTLVNDGPWYSF
jgi:hypothetical protein